MVDGSGVGGVASMSRQIEVCHSNVRQCVGPLFAGIPTTGPFAAIRFDAQVAPVVRFEQIIARESFATAGEFTGEVALVAFATTRRLW